MAPCLYSSSSHSACRANILIVKSIFTLFVRNAWSCAAMSNPSLSYFSFPLLTLGRIRKIIPPPWYKGKGGLMDPPPWVFEILQHFETIFAFSGKLLIFSTRWDICYWRCRCCRPVTSPKSWLLSWICSRIRNQVKTMKINHFLRLTYKITHK